MEDPESLDPLEQFLRKQREFANETPVDLEYARREAKHLAQLQQEIIQLLESYPKTTFLGENKPGDVFVKRNPFGIALGAETSIERIDGIGGKFIHFTHYFKKNPDEFAEKLGIDTLDRLDIGIHTDEQTREQIEAIEGMNQRDINILQTIYLFDKNGNFGKVISLPRFIKDNRPDIGGGIVIQKYVQADMKPGDFELAGAALTMLRDRLQLSQTEV